MTLAIAETFPDAPGGPVVLLEDGQTYRLSSGGWKRLDPLPGSPAAAPEEAKRAAQPTVDDYQDLDDVREDEDGG